VAKDKAEKPDVVAMLNAATADDLENVRGRIAELGKELDGLRAVEKLLDVRLNGKPERAKPQRRVKLSPSFAAAGNSGLQERQKKVLMHLRARGGLTKAQLSKETGIALQGPNCLAVVLDLDWFHVSPEGMVTLTSKGDAVHM